MKVIPHSIVLALKVLLTAAILWILYWHSQLQFGLLYTFVDHPWATLSIFILSYMMVIFHAWRWHRLNAAQNIDLSFAQTITPSYIATALNSVLPGSIGGDFFRLYFVLKKFSSQKSNSILAILVDRITGLLGVLILACITAPFYFDTFRHNTTLFYLLVISFTCCVLSILAFFTMVILLSEKAGMAAWAEKLMRQLSLSRQLLSLLEAIHKYRNAKLVILESLLASIATQGLLLIVIWLIVNVMGLPSLAVGIYMLALVIGQIANLLPLTPGGLGVGEAAFANVIYILHPGAVAAYATVFFALRLIGTIAYLPGVLIGLFGFDLIHQKPDPHFFDVAAKERTLD